MVSKIRERLDIIRNPHVEKQSKSWNHASMLRSSFKHLRASLRVPSNLASIPVPHLFPYQTVSTMKFEMAATLALAAGATAFVAPSLPVRARIASSSSTSMMAGERSKSLPMLPQPPLVREDGCGWKKRGGERKRDVCLIWFMLMTSVGCAFMGRRAVESFGCLGLDCRMFDDEGR